MSLFKRSIGLHHLRARDSVTASRIERRSTLIIGEKIKSWFSVESAADITGRIVETHGCRTALDIGCGTESPFTLLRPKILSVGLDASQASLQQSRDRNAHDHYVEANVLTDDVKQILAAKTGFAQFDIVGLFGVIEHLPKHVGYEFLRRCEDLATTFVVLETPNGFVPQGADFGNEHMRHLSGWFIQDLEGLGYTVMGTTGTRYLRGTRAGLKYPYRGVGSLDVFLARLLRANRRPRHAFNLYAYKDLRGFPAIVD